MMHDISFSLFFSVLPWFLFASSLVLDNAEIDGKSRKSSRRSSLRKLSCYGGTLSRGRKSHFQGWIVMVFVQQDL